MIIHNTKIFSGLLSQISATVKEYCYYNHIPNLPVVVDDGTMGGHRASFQPEKVRIMVSYELLKYLLNKPENQRPWFILYVIRHELVHYEQYFELKKTGRHLAVSKYNEFEAILEGFRWAKEVFRKLTLEQINPAIKNPSSLYESFHGNPPKELRKVKLHVPKKGEHLVAIGKLAKIEYIPFGSSRRKNTQFYHVSGDTGEGVLPTNLILCCDQSGKNFYLVKEDDTKEFPRFSERGILG